MVNDKRVYLFDSTLRDGAQSQGVDFTVPDKVAIARALDKLGRLWLFAPHRHLVRSPGGFCYMAKVIDYYLTLNSPYAYLGSTRLEKIARDHGARLCVKPVNYGEIVLGYTERAIARAEGRL